MEELIQRYKRELNQRINLKKTLNKTKEQIILDNFKYFDLTSSNYCNADHFIKANERIGVKMRDKNELYRIFNYYDTKDSGLINYRTFARQILNSYPYDNNPNKGDLFIHDNEYKTQRDNYNIRKKTSKDNYYFKTENNDNYRYTQKYSTYNKDNNYNYKYNHKHYFQDKDKYNRDYENHKTNYNINNDNNIIHIKEKPFLDNIISQLLNNNYNLPSKSVLLLYKNFKINQNRLYNKMSINEFMDIIINQNINLEINEIKHIFDHYQNSKDGIFYYELFFDDILDTHWGGSRLKIAKNKTSEILKDKMNITFEEFYNLINISNNDFFKNKLNISYPDEYYNELVKIFLDIKNLSSTNDNILYEKDILQFFKFISFGIKSNEDFYTAINYIFNTNKNYNNHSSKERHMEHKKYDKNKNSNTSLFSPSLKIMRKYMCEHGLKSFINIIKEFDYYSNGNGFISKYDFSKVLNKFNLNLASNDIDEIFNIFSDDKKQLYLNFYKFIDILLNEFFSKERLLLVKDIYNKIEKYVGDMGRNEINLDVLKDIYNTKLNYYDFYENFLGFHHSYYIKKLNGGKAGGYNKNDFNRNFKITFDEFFNFYKMVSFTVEKYDIFKNIIFNEWSNTILTKKNSFKNSNNNYNENNKYDDYDEYSIKKNNYTLNYTKFKEDLTMNPQNNNKNYNQGPLLSENNYNKIQNIPFDKSKHRHGSRDNFPKKEENIRLMKTNKSQKQYKVLKIFNNTFDNATPKKQNYNNSNNINALEKLTLKLKMRGLRGLMNLHKQFIFTCNNLSLVSLSNFVIVMRNQKLNLENRECKQIFIMFKKKDSKYLDFAKFMRHFKRPLNEKRLEAVDNAFSKLDGDSDNNIFIETIKKKYNPRGDPLFLKGKKNEEEVSTEFLDCFELNYNLLTAVDNQNVTNVVSFEEFANFYEYVSFLYDDDDEFVKLVNESWG